MNEYLYIIWNHLETGSETRQSRKILVTKGFQMLKMTEVSDANLLARHTSCLVLGRGV